VDTEYGGLLCDFDRRWRPCGPHEKLLEFQARQTWLAADLLRVAPGNEHVRKAVQHGFRFLREVMWDQRSGGWFHRVRRTGEPLEAHTKHVHGVAYAISACAAVYTATRDPSALTLAQEGFAWIDQFAHDDRYGGYFGFLRREGTVIREPAQNPLHEPVDTIGTPIGLKDANVHSDLLEAFGDLYSVWRDDRVAQRLHEAIDIMARRMQPPSHVLCFFCHPDWTPAPHLMRYGSAFQTASRLLSARHAADDAAAQVDNARRLVDHCVRHAWDGRRGGFFFASPHSPPINLEGQDLIVRAKSWWVQVEAIKALLALSRTVDDGEPYDRYFRAQWRFLRRFMLDEQYGGIYSYGFDDLPRLQRRLGAGFAPAHLTRKGDAWKDGSHDGRAWLFCAATLRTPQMR
jgi:mannobiose 2-epimerase